METGVAYNEQQLHQVRYCRELVYAKPRSLLRSLRPLLKLGRETERCQRHENAAVSAARPRVGRPAQGYENGSWRRLDHGADLGAGDRRWLTLRFDQATPSATTAASPAEMEKLPTRRYVCARLETAQQTSAGVCAAANKPPLAPWNRAANWLCLYDQKRRHGNRNRAETLAVARGWLLTSLPWIGNQRDFGPLENAGLQRPQISEIHRMHTIARPARPCMKPTQRTELLPSPRLSTHCFESWPQTPNSIFGDGLFRARDCKWMSGSANHRNRAEAHCSSNIPETVRFARSPSMPGHPCLNLTDDLHGFGKQEIRRPRMVANQGEEQLPYSP